MTNRTHTKYVHKYSKSLILPLFASTFALLLFLYLCVSFLFYLKYFPLCIPTLSALLTHTHTCRSTHNPTNCEPPIYFPSDYYHPSRDLLFVLCVRVCVL